MLHARLTVDLPSAPLPRSGKILRLLRSLVAKPASEAGDEQLVGDALEPLLALLEALGAAGFDDVIAVSAGGRSIYTDTQERRGDLGPALERLVASGRMGPGFGTATVVLCQITPTLHTVAEVTLVERTTAGQPELVVALVARARGLRIGRDEGPASYQARVEAELAAGALDRLRDQLRDQLNDAVERVRQPTLPGRGLAAEPEGPTVRVVAPGPAQVGRFRHLGFHRQRRAAVYQPAPTDRRAPAYDHAHVHYYFDPYHDLLCWVVVGALLDGRCTTPGVEVIDPGGTLLFTSDAVPGSPRLPVPRDAVTLGDDQVEVAATIPSVGIDQAEAGSPHTPGFGGEGNDG